MISYTKEIFFCKKFSELQLSQFYLATCQNHLDLTATFSSFSVDFRLEKETTANAMPKGASVSRKKSLNICYSKPQVNSGTWRTSLSYITEHHG